MEMSRLLCDCLLSDEIHSLAGLLLVARARPILLVIGHRTRRRVEKRVYFIATPQHLNTLIAVVYTDKSLQQCLRQRSVARSALQPRRPRDGAPAVPSLRAARPQQDQTNSYSLRRHRHRHADPMRLPGTRDCSLLQRNRRCSSAHRLLSPLAQGQATMRRRATMEAPRQRPAV